MYDARQVANCLLDIGDSLSLPITHLSLQKIVYFSHGLAYARFGHGLISNRVEAWKHGPVIRELYFSFSRFEEHRITQRATLLDFGTKSHKPIEYHFPAPVVDHLKDIMSVYGPIPACQLVAMTHETGTPWERTISHAKTNANVGMLIDEELIRSFFAPVSGART